MKIFPFFLLLPFPYSCFSDDYSVTDSLTHRVEVVGINFLEIECFCSDGVEVEKANGELLVIEVRGTMDSQGYHGEQTKPTEAEMEAFLSFDTEIRNDTLKILSRESTFMHHASLIDDLTIYIPDGIEYEIQKIELSFH